MVAGASPAIGPISEAGAIGPGLAARADINLSALTMKPPVSGQAQEPEVSASLELRPNAGRLTQAGGAAVVPVPAGQGAIVADVSPGTTPTVDVPAGSGQGERGSASAINSAAFDQSGQDGAADRLQAQRKAQEEERRSHGTSLRRWLQDHFPFLF